MTKKELRQIQYEYAHRAALEFASQCLATRLEQYHGENRVQEDGAVIFGSNEIELGDTLASHGDFYGKCYCDTLYSVLKETGIDEEYYKISNG